MSEEREFCPTCKIILEDGNTHLNKDDCIEAQGAKILSQRKSAEHLGEIIAGRVLDIVGELCRRPDVGVPYYTNFPTDPNDPMGERTTELHHSQVVGVYEAIRKLYIEMGDWSSLTEAQDELFKEQQLNLRFQSVLQEVNDLDNLPRPLGLGNLPDDLKQKIVELLHPGESG